MKHEIFTKILILGMDCEKCGIFIKNIISRLKGIYQVDICFLDYEANIYYNPKLNKTSSLLDIIRFCGYTGYIEEEIYIKKY